LFLKSNFYLSSDLDDAAANVRGEIFPHLIASLIVLHGVTEEFGLLWGGQWGGLGEANDLGLFEKFTDSF